MIVARGGKRGKTSGRGGKGQSARAGNKRRPEWRDIIKRVPKLRGRGVNQNKAVSEKPFVLNVDILEAVFNSGDMVTPTTLVERGAVPTKSGRTPKVKILGDGVITKALKVSGCAISENAKTLIEKAGGTVTILDAKTEKPASKPVKIEIEKEKAPTPANAEKKTEKKAAKK